MQFANPAWLWLLILTPLPWQFERLANPAWLWLLILTPLPWLFERLRPRIAWPSLTTFPDRRRIGWVSLRALPAVLRGLALGCLAVALARPQTVGGASWIAGKGVAIVVALDQSSSMNTVDFPADRGARLIPRLKAATTTFADFVKGRVDDLIGLVAFANYPDLTCPPTSDHAFLIDVAGTLRPARPGDDGTNIGDAIAVSLDALLVAPPKKKVLVLLTDGNNEPAVPQPLDPEQAAILARELGVTLHTIAIGHRGGVVQGVDPDTQLPVMAEVAGPNLPLLERLAELTGGRSFVAADADTLARVFDAINKLERSPIRGQILTRYDEHYAAWAASALALLIVDSLLSLGRLRRLP
jgi:Ca-activated chloride channel family protein